MEIDRLQGKLMGLPGKAHRNVGKCASVCMCLSVTICRSVNMNADICTLCVSISVYPYSHALCMLYVHVIYEQCV